MITAKRKKPSDRAMQIIICCVLYASLILFIASLFFISSNYQKLYKSPKVEKGEADFSGVEISSRSVPCTLTGEWEFYYNRWIVTDNDKSPCDGMIKMPDVWSGKDFGAGKLSKSGYASYRMVAKNVQPDISLTVFRNNTDISYRVFFNGRLHLVSGTVSKDVKETKVSGRTDEKIPFITDGGDVEIVIEISANSHGGLNAAAWLNYDWTGNTYGARLRSFTFVALGISVAAVIVSLLTFAFFGYKRDVTTPLFMLALFAHFLTSKDVTSVLAFPFTLTRILAVITATAAFALFIAHVMRCGVKYGKRTIALSIACFALSLILLFSLYGTKYTVLPFAALILTGCAYLIPIAGSKMPTAEKWLYCTFLTVLMSVFCAELCDGLGMIVFGTEYYFSIELMLMLACFVAIWLWKMAKTAKIAMRVSELENELTTAKHKMLKAQIKPHFVYNSLTAIQSQYRTGLDEGDRAVEQFARHLRLVTDSDETDTIPFDGEIQNVLNYFELENLRSDGRLTLLLDLQFSDFSVPVLSLQPLVENAIHHGGLREMRDGCITLSSFKQDGKVCITVGDNGRGFDTKTAAEGVGLENTRKRFNLLNASMKIESAPGAGAKVIIEIPLEK